MEQGGIQQHRNKIHIYVWWEYKVAMKKKEIDSGEENIMEPKNRVGRIKQEMQEAPIAETLPSNKPTWGAMNDNRNPHSLLVAPEPSSSESMATGIVLVNRALNNSTTASAH